MGNTARDLIDDQHGTTPLPGDRTKNTARIPGLVSVAVAAAAFVVCVASFAGGHVGVGIGAIIVTLLTAGAALGWLTMEGRRIRQVERDWTRAHHPAA
jgi:hypothetical protein